MSSTKISQSTTFDPRYDDYDYPCTYDESYNTPSGGYAGFTTPLQNQQVVDLRTALEQEGYKKRLDTLTLLRFLRARKFKVDLAKAMFIQCEKWRSEFGGAGGVDNLLRTFDYTEKSAVFKYYPQYYHKTDKDGRPVYIEELGKIDLKALYNITTSDRMLQNLVVEYEKVADPRLPACSRKAGHLLETCCTIMDVKGVGLSSVSSVYSYLKHASEISQNYYPERLGKLYIINAPWGFSAVFNVIKAFLDPVTVEKIHVLGSDYTSTLLSQIPKENLPSKFGGSCKCPSPGCELSDLGPWKEAKWLGSTSTKPPVQSTISSPNATSVKSVDDSAVVDGKLADSVAAHPSVPTV